MKKKIIIVGGDPNSINSEIIYKAWRSQNKVNRNLMLIIGNYNLFVHQYKKLNIKIKVNKLNKYNDYFDLKKINVLDLPLKFKDPFKVSAKNCSKYITKSLSIAHKLAVEKKVKAIINCSISKKLLSSSMKIGVTEFLASKCKIKINSEIMMITNSQFSVVPLTTHIDIKEVAGKIDQKLIITKILSLSDNFKKLFKFNPRIGILGLNPHNGELRKNSEEKNIIIPAIKKLKKRKINLTGPIVADTAFISSYKKFDVLVGMYHDQVLSPFKSLYKFDAINVTLGLNYVRVSPDHGPALDIIKKNKAHAGSLNQCIKFINKLIK